MDDKPQDAGPTSTSSGDAWPTSAKVVSGALALVAAGAIGFGFAKSSSDSHEPVSETPSAATTASGEVDPSQDSSEAVDPSDGSGLSPSEGSQEFGTAIELRGMDTSVSVTPEEWLGELPEDQYGYVGANQELLGLSVKFENTGEGTYDGYPSNDMVLIDGESGQWVSDGEPAAPGSDCAPIFEDLRLVPGTERRGCVTFIVPKGTEPNEIQVTLDSGTGADTGIWTVPR